MARRHPAVAAHVEVPPGFGGDDADVLAARLRTFPGTSGHPHLDLVWGAQTPVAQLEVDGHLHRILLPVPAPVTADAALHGAQRLAVGVSGFHAALHQAPPDLGQLVHARAEHIDALAAGDLGVEVEFLGDLADQDEVVGGDVAARHAGHHRIAAVALDVGQEVVVGVLQRRLLAVEDVLRTGRGQDRRDDGFAYVATLSGAEPLDQTRERPNRGGRDDFEQLGTRVAEMLAQRLGLRDAFSLEQLLEQRHARTTAGARLGTFLQRGHVVAALGDRAGEITLGDVVAGTDLGRLRKRADTETC